jgi:CRISPR-associated exonuclease Cas4
MFSADVAVGVVFAGKDRRRHEVQVDGALAARVRQTTAAVRALLDEGVVPEGVRDARCRRCSLRPGCMPDAPRHVEGLFTPRPEGSWHD